MGYFLVPLKEFVTIYLLKLSDESELRAGNDSD